MSENADAMMLMKALIGKMESMDAELSLLRKQVANPTSMFQKSGFVKAITPATEDVWGDPLRGEREDVINKAANEINNAINANIPDSNEDWFETSWDEIHAMANQAAEQEGRRVDPQ
ncbi:MAG: hypothetical protein HOC79_03995 [Euryarchaeota archaeon]|jgi:hypothetical protein|nr:hypothetical protein [Euryarchaeota archaeon]